jgi:hypothetical protein
MIYLFQNSKIFLGDTRSPSHRKRLRLTVAVVAIWIHVSKEEWMKNEFTI